MACRESRIVEPDSFETVVGQVGLINDFVQWCADAWDDLQIERPRWRWMIREASATALTVNVANYAASYFGITSFGQWIEDYDDGDGGTIYNVTIYRQDQGVAYETHLPYLNWDAFTSAYRRGSVASNFPQHWSINPENGELHVGPAPNVVYMLKPRYVKGQQSRLALDATEPELPSRHHKLIAYLGAQRCAERESLPPEITAAINRAVSRGKVNLDREQNGGYSVGGEPIG